MIGIDIVENERMKDKSIEFIKRILSKKEFEIYSNFSLEDKKIQYLASRFAAKEAIFKTFKKGNKDMNYNRISVLNDEDGAPFIEFEDDIKSNLEISISHEKNYSIAIVMKTN